MTKFDLRLLYKVAPQTLYQFVASNFLPALKGPLNTYLDYSNKWEWGDNGNEIVRNYDTNCKRVEILKNAIPIEETDPLSIFEGGFTGYDLRMWVDELKRKGLLARDFTLSSGSWSAVDRRALGIDSSSEALGRLVTGEIREILSSVNSESEERIDAVKMLLDRFREKMRGENVKEVYLNLAFGAYLQGEDSPFESASEAINVFAGAVKKIEEEDAEKETAREEALGEIEDEEEKAEKKKEHEREQLPDIKLVWTIRRDKDFGENLDYKSMDSMRKLAAQVQEAVENKQIAGISFMGIEDRELAEYGSFFDAFEQGSKIPLIVLTGQVFPGSKESEDVRKDRLRKNIDYIGNTLAKRFKILGVWGMQDIGLFTEDEIEHIDGLSEIGKKQIPLIITPTYDLMTGLDQIGEKSVAQRLKKWFSIIYATANAEYATGGCSVTIDMLIDLIRAEISDEEIGRALMRQLSSNRLRSV